MSYVFTLRNELTGNHICTRCLTPVKKKEEYLKYDHQHKKCFKKPNWMEKKRCEDCKHYPHIEDCKEPVAHDGKFNPTVYCGCKTVQK